MKFRHFLNKHKGQSAILYAFRNKWKIASSLQDLDIFADFYLNEECQGQKIEMKFRTHD